MAASWNSAADPICTKRNVFMRGDKRFLIRGIWYTPDRSAYDTGAEPDFLSPARLNDLKRDIAVFHELGLNTIRVLGLNSGNDHSEAFSLLAQAGIYVLVELFEENNAATQSIQKRHLFDLLPGNMKVNYTTKMLKSRLKVADELIHYSNLLGFAIDGEGIMSPSTSVIAEAVRAALADVKRFIQLRAPRHIPVGVSIHDSPMMRFDTVQYFTAGFKDERADFLAPECWTWAYRSNFQISGWKNWVQSLTKYPVPVFLGAYGAYVGKPRVWQEVACLYCDNMTGVFSGGCIYTYSNGISKNYDIVKIHEDASVEKKPEFALLRSELENARSLNGNGISVPEQKDYDSWTGIFPELRANKWRATAAIPRFFGSWNDLLQAMDDDKEWVLVSDEDLPLAQLSLKSD